MAERLVCSYGGAVALDGATVSLSPGEFVAVVGPNGSGKTTLVRALSRALRPAAGRVTLDGRDLYAELDARASARAIAVVPQESPLDFEFTVEEFVRLGRHPHLGALDREGPRDLEKAREAMDRADCGSLRGRALTELSGGERRRAMLARALAQEPAYLLLDEPTAHLDVRHQIEVLRLARAHPAAKLAVLHDLNFARAFASRVVMLDRGRVVADGAPAEVLVPARLDAVFGPHLRVVEGHLLPRVEP